MQINLKGYDLKLKFIDSGIQLVLFKVVKIVDPIPWDHQTREKET